MKSRNQHEATPISTTPPSATTDVRRTFPFNTPSDSNIPIVQSYDCIEAHIDLHSTLSEYSFNEKSNEELKIDLREELESLESLSDAMTYESISSSKHSSDQSIAFSTHLNQISTNQSANQTPRKPPSWYIYKSKSTL